MEEKRIAADGWMYTEEEYWNGTSHATWERAGVEEPGTTTVSKSSEEHTETITASPDKTVSQPSSRLKLRLTDLGLECVLAKVRLRSGGFLLRS